MHKKNDRCESGQVGFNQNKSSKVSEISKWKILAARNELSAPQHIRLFDCILNSPGVLTWQIARTCGIGYPPCRAFEVNNLIARHGLYLHCVKPAQGAANRFGESSNSHAWYLDQLPGASSMGGG